jgi:hypothetical protein
MKHVFAVLLMLFSTFVIALDATDQALLKEHGISGPKILLHTDNWEVKPSKIDMDGIAFKGQSKSLIDWKLDHYLWLDFNYWSEQRKERDNFPEWKIKLREIQHTELIGKVIKCFGTCNIFRGNFPANADYSSRLMEGDELITDEHSYAWVVLADGSLFRMSPKTSLTFNEFNIGTKDYFYFLRLNHGHLHWQVRKTGEFDIQNLAETDLLFYPLMLKESNRDYFSMLDYAQMTHDERLLYQTRSNPGHRTQYLKLNEYLKENEKEMTAKNTKVFLVTPSATYFAENAHFDIFYPTNGEAKFRYYNQISGFKNRDQREAKVVAYLRGYNNREESSLEADSWYQVSTDGRQIETTTEHANFKAAELFVRRIPTIQMARELMIRESFKFLSDSYDAEKLAVHYGYRLWDDGSQELAQRMEFLKEYTRRTETTNLFSAAKVFADDIPDTFDGQYVHRALTEHMQKLKDMYAKNRSVIPELNELQYYIWILKYAKKQ